MAESSKVDGVPPLTQFTLFPNLPKELRIRVWQLAAREPRVVEICWVREAQDRFRGIWDEFTPPNPPVFYSPTPIPFVLHINRESRGIALENYALSFPQESRPAQIYYSPSVDILYFPGWSSIHICPFKEATTPEAKDSIRRIAIDNLIWITGWENRQGSIENGIKIAGFGNLEEFLLVTRERHDTGRPFRREFMNSQKGLPKFEEYADDDRNVQFDLEGELKDCIAEFERIKVLDSAWKMPEIRYLRLKRDGVIV